MKRYLTFVGIGSVFATVEEFLTIVVIRGDVGAYVFTLLILFPVFLTFVWMGRLFIIDRLVRPRASQSLCHFFAFGVVGLMMEWFLMNLAPWSNPAAHPFVMLIFQLGMFSFWATVAFAPTLFIDQDQAGTTIRTALLRFYAPYFAVVYVIALAVPDSLKFVTIIPLVIFGYLFLNVYYLAYFRRSLGLSPVPPLPNEV
jgi:hypothetical protein